MSSHRERYETILHAVRAGMDAGAGGLVAEDERTTGRHVRVGGRDLANFGSCSYLGLEVDPRLVEAAVEAVRAHGVQFCASRTFMSSPLYGDLQESMEAIFQAPVVLAATTTLGHLASLPVLVDEDDAILLDLQVHSSVQMASRFVGSFGTRVEIVGHNDLDRIEERVSALAKECRQVWYMADGIYSMFGDRAPIEALVAMLDRHEHMRLFVDDAHGMSWCGPRGAGSVFERVPLHPRMVHATGLGKGFGTGGGVIVLPDEEQRDRVLHAGPTMMFSGPLQPPVLGAAIASARIHLSDEIDLLQRELRERMALLDDALAAHGLPIVSPADTPVGFLGVGEIPACHALVKRLMADGFFVNPAQFPAAPRGRSGIRYLVTRHHTDADLEALAEACARHWEPVVRESGVTPEGLFERFGLTSSLRAGPRSPAPVPTEGPLSLDCVHSIEKLDATEWDRTAGSRGCLASGAMRVFERVFCEEAGPENHWRFHYFIVRDAAGEAVLATAFTSALWKADMLAPAEVSRAVERLRAEDPLHLTQRVLSQGSLLSEGDHLWLREPADSPRSRHAVERLIEAVRAEAESVDAAMTVFRDVPEKAQAKADLYERAGLLAMPAPVAHVLEPIPRDPSNAVAELARDHRRHHRRAVAPYDEAYALEVVAGGSGPLDQDMSRRLHALYEEVRARSLELNTFALPRSLWSAIAETEGWELVLFREAGDPEGPVVGFFAAFGGPAGYVPLVVGLDYAYVESRGLYRQVLRQTIERARALDADRVLLGFGADLEKRRFGAQPEANRMFVEIGGAPTG